MGQRIIEIGSTLDNALQQLLTRQTFMLTADDAESGGIDGGFCSGDGDNVLLYAVQAKINQSTGEVTFPPMKIGDITAQNIVVEQSIDDGAPKNGFAGDLADINNKISFTFDNTTKVAELSYTDGSDIDVYVDSVRIKLEDGSAKLTAAPVPGSYDGWITYYIDTDGQLTAALGSYLENFFRTRCLVTSVYHDPTNEGIPSSLGYPGAETSMLWQYHGAEAVDWRTVHHFTERTKTVGSSFNMSTLSDETTPTSDLSISSGTVADEDIILSFPAVDGAAGGVWVAYYFDGFNTNGDPAIRRGPKTVSNLSQIFITDTEIGIGASNNIIYSEFTYDVDGEIAGVSPAVVSDNSFTLVHIFVACGVLAHNVVIAGQTAYNSIEDARESIIPDVHNLYIADEILTEANHIGSAILDHTGNIVCINNECLLFYDNRPDDKTHTTGSSGEIVVADGAGETKAVSSINLDNLDILSAFKLSNLAGNENNVLFLSATGVVNSIDIFGTGIGGGGSYNVVEAMAVAPLTVTNGNETDTDLIGLDHTFTDDVSGTTITYSLDMEIYSVTEGVNIELYKTGDPTPIDSQLFTGTWGASVVFEKTIVVGSVLTSDEYYVQAAANKKFQSIIINTGSLINSGSLGSAASDAYFIEADAGYGTDTTLLGTPKMPGLPISAAGLTAGDLWNDAGIVKVV